MADSSLDDFFAKKDKNRKKTKTKVAADAEDSQARLVKKDKKKRDKEKTNTSGGLINLQANTQEDDEWKDFEEAKEVDYSGLRIQTLQISKEEQDRDGRDGDEHGDEDADNKDRRDGASGPWNKSSATAATPAPVLQTEETKEEVTPKGPSKYVPPAQRQAAASASSAQKLSHSRKKKEAPNVHSEEDFPTLGGGLGPGKGSSQQYSSSTSSDLIDNPNQRQGVNLSLENKFSALQD